MRCSRIGFFNTSLNKSTAKRREATKKPSVSFQVATICFLNLNCVRLTLGYLNSTFTKKGVPKVLGTFQVLISADL